MNFAITMIINFAIILATVVPNCQGKYIELLSNEEFQDKIARRAGAGDVSNEDVGNRDDNIPDIDLTLTDNVQSYTGVRRKNSANNANFNEIILPLHEGSVTFDDYSKNTTEEKKVNQEKNIPDSYFSDTTLAETSVTLPTTVTNSDKKSTTNIEAQAPEYYLETRVPENDSTVNNNKSILKGTVSYIHNSSNGTLTDGSITDSVIDTTTYKNEDVVTTHDSRIFTAMAQNTGEVNTATTEDYTAVIKNSLRSEHLEDTTIIPVLTPIINEEQRTKNPEKIDNTIMHAVKNITKSVQCLYCYKVYDLLGLTKRENQPFLSKDQPHFHHVYKYLRNFVNYNSKNRLNEVEEKSIELHKHQVRERNNDIDDTAKARELLTAFNNESRKFVVFKKKNNIPSISDKINVQYQRQGSNREKAKVKKSVRLFEDTNIDILPELMHAILGAKSVNVTTFDSYKGLVDMDKYRYARLENLFDFISVTDDIALFQHSIVRKMSNDESKIKIHLNVLKDLILEDSKALKQYDWLATTVQIESALTKILKLIKCIRQSEPIHPADLQILKYIVILHNFSLGVKQDNKLDNKLRKIMKLLPTNKRKRKNKLLKDKGLIKRVWLYLTLLLDLVEEDEFSNLFKFFIDVQDGLFGLHEAIRHIADVTKFDRQDWYGNLKQLYLSTDEKHLRELLLHISMSRLVNLVENSCKQGLDNDIIQFLQTHEKEAKRIVEELLFIGEIVNEI